MLPADGDQQAGQIAALGQAQPAHAQQDRHDKIVADHGRERDRLDDHHGGRRRQAADEGDQGERALAFRHRQGQHRRYRRPPSRPENEKPTERDRQHEHIDEQEIEREQPGGLVEMALVRSRPP